MAQHILDGRYLLLEELGKGGMAVVWRGHDQVLDRPVAIKIPAVELAQDADFIERLRAEARAAAGLSHPHITSVHDYGESTSDSGQVVAYVVMELLQGSTLRLALANGRCLHWRQAATIGAQVAEALAEAHRHGIVHRDITPANVMLTPAGAKVLDFGIAAAVGGTEPGEPDQVFGTPAYMAPERLSQGVVTPALDVYALGMVIYRALSGGLPWLVDGQTDLWDAHQYLRPAPLPNLPGLPPELAELCQACLAKKPEERPTSANVARTLSRVAGLTPPPLPSPRTETTQPLAERTRLDLSMVDAEADAPRADPTRLTPLSRFRAPVVAGLGSVALGIAAWGFTGAPADPAAADVTPPSAGRQGCEVTYALTKDDGRSFDVSIGVRSQGSQLAFAWPGDQRTTTVPEVPWHQDGQRVALTVPDGDAQVRLSGTYRDANSLPTVFEVDGVRCRATVTATPQAAPPPQIPVNGGKGPGEDGHTGKGHGKKGKENSDA